MNDLDRLHELFKVAEGLKAVRLGEKIKPVRKDKLNRRHKKIATALSALVAQSPGLAQAVTAKVDHTIVKQAAADFNKAAFELGQSDGQAFMKLIRENTCGLKH